MNHLASWYRQHGRHSLPWRNTTDRWAVLVSEVMLAQTQVQRVAIAWPVFMHQFPTVAATAASSPADVITAWGRLGYPRRARRLWDTAVIVDTHGWPDNYCDLPGVGPYTAGALAAQVDNRADAIGIDVNIRRVVQRIAGKILNDTDARTAAVAIAAPMVGRNRLLALMDIGATICTPRDPLCAQCPLHTSCTTQHPLESESRSRQAPYKGSLREKRGAILAVLREHGVAPSANFDATAVQSLVHDQLVSQRNGMITLACD